MSTSVATYQPLGTPAHPPRVLFCDGQRLVAEALGNLLAPQFDPIGVVEDGLELVKAAEALRPDVVVAEVTLPRLDGIQALARLRRNGNGVRVVFVTMHRDANLARRAFDAGASGFVLKHCPSGELVAAVHAALNGAIYVTPRLGQMPDLVRGDCPAPWGEVERLTQRQREVLQLLASGRSPREIASHLSIAVRTVQFHKYRMMASLHLNTSAALIQFAVQRGFVDH